MTDAKANSKALAAKVAILQSINFERLDELLAEKKWVAALNLIDAISADAKSVARSCTALATKINKRCWTPLLDELEGSSDA